MGLCMDLFNGLGLKVHMLRIGTESTQRLQLSRQECRHYGNEHLLVGLMCHSGAQ